jgi:hypothetical protein
VATEPDGLMSTLRNGRCWFLAVHHPASRRCCPLLRQLAGLGLSGNTGYSSSPHLHFAVSRVTRSADALNTVSIPFKFYVGNPATVFIPQQGMVVKADYRRPMDVPQAIGVQR